MFQMLTKNSDASSLFVVYCSLSHHPATAILDLLPTQTPPHHWFSRQRILEERVCHSRSFGDLTVEDQAHISCISRWQVDSSLTTP